MPFDALPDAILTSQRAVVWTLEQRNGKSTKVPRVADDPARYAAVDDPSTWRPFSVARDTVLDGKAEGPGIVLGEGRVGVDLDHCRNRDTGEIEPWAWTIIRALDSYTEVSPSGTGIHVLLRGTLPPGRRRKGPVEMYCDGRYFTVTGEHVAGTPTTINERSAQLAAVHAQTFNESSHAQDRVHDTASGDDAALLEKARTAANGAKFQALERGDDAGYASASEADLAFCCLLVFWTDAEVARIDRLFRQSGRMRAKWDTRRGSTTYGEQTIAKAIAETRQTYSTRETARASASSEPPIITPLRRTTRPGFPESDPAMFTGVLGELVDEFEPYTEASRVGMAAHALIAVGSLIGRQAGAAHVVVDGFAAQFLNEFVLVVGETGDARKQTSWAPIRRVCTRIDPSWRHSSGLISGEGLIWDLRDASTVRRGKRLDVDEGITDKRLLLVEEEFTRVIGVGRREGCSLFDTLKEAWDSDVLRTKGKHHPAVATDPHLSLVGHITPALLVQRMSAEDFSSGLLNRFLHIAVKCSKVLVNPPRIEASRLAHWADRLADVVAFGQHCGELRRAPDAQELWNDIYPNQLRRPRRGLMAALSARAPSHVMRVAGLFAVLAMEHEVSVPSLQAAHAWWNYGEATMAWVYGVSITGSTSADAILRELQQAGPTGLTKSEMFGLRLARKADELNHDLDTLVELGLAAGRLEHSPKGGRGTERWTAL